MSNKVNMNVFLHSLLVIKQMNDFTVSEAKEALLREHTEFTDDKKTRMFIYRQLSNNIENGLIKRTDRFEAKGEQVIYSTTEKFLTSNIVPIKRTTKKKKITAQRTSTKVTEKISYKNELKKELMTSEIDLNTTLEEAKEYKRLAERFPELQEKIQQYQVQTKDKSIKLLGKVHALQNLLGYAVTEYHSC